MPVREVVRGQAQLNDKDHAYDVTEKPLWTINLRIYNLEKFVYSSLELKAYSSWRRSVVEYG